MGAALYAASYALLESKAPSTLLIALSCQQRVSPFVDLAYLQRVTNTLLHMIDPGECQRLDFDQSQFHEGPSSTKRQRLRYRLTVDIQADGVPLFLAQRD